VWQRPQVVGQVPVHDGGQVARLGLQPLQPLVLARAAQGPVRRLSQGPEVLGVAASNLDGVGPMIMRWDANESVTLPLPSGPGIKPEESHSKSQRGPAWGHAQPRHATV